MLLLVPLAAGYGRPDPLGHTDSGTHPIRCHYEQQQDAARCEDLLAYLETAWDVQIDGMASRRHRPTTARAAATIWTCT